ncbi:MAG: phage terminase large subunit [bacterium]
MSLGSQELHRWVRMIENQPTPVLPRPERFVRHLLGYDFTRFHKNWWEFASNNQYSLVLAPRGHGKSTILTVSFTLYRILDNPETRALIVSNTADQAEAFLREIKNHLENNQHIRKLFGPLKASPWTESQLLLASRLTNAKEATVTALGIRGPVISRHYDLVILDDVVDEDSARSRLLRERTLTWYYKELLPTLEPEGKLSIIGTRYHHDDLYGKLMEAGMPCLREKAVIETARGKKALWEKKFPLKLLLDKQEETGPAIFNAQYQNDVSAMKGRIFRPEWIKTDHMPNVFRKYQGVDLAIGSADHNDYFAHVTIGEKAPGSYHIISAYQARLSFEEQFTAISSLFYLHDRPASPVVSVAVEANAYQEVMVQRLRKETELPVSPVVHTRDKIARAMRMQGLFQSGGISFPQPSERAPGTDHLPALVEELLAFPDSDHDDLVDALEMAITASLEVSRYSELPVISLNHKPDE